MDNYKQNLEHDKDIVKYETNTDITTKKCQKSATKVRKMGNSIYISKEHTEESHRRILTLYSKSIAYAPRASEELALGYSNRSALLKHLNKYEECIVDIDRAFEITNSTQLKAKLDLRRKECEALVNEMVNKTEKILSKANKFKSLVNETEKAGQLLNLLKDASLHSSYLNEKLQLPEIIPSTAIPTLADSVSLKYNETYGRHIVVNQDIKPGEIIAIEKGYLTFPLKHQLYLICSHCLQFCWNGLPCDTCVFLIYCSEKCKKEAFIKYHDVECCVLPFLFGLQLDGIELINYLAAVRLFIKAIKKEGIESLIRDAKVVDSYKDLPMKELFQNGVFCNKKFKSLYSLINHKDSSKCKDKDNFYSLLIVNLLKKYTKLFISIELLEDPKKLNEIYSYLKMLVAKIRSIICSNSYIFQDISCKCLVNGVICNGNCDKSMGLILAPSCGFFNHSCVPNVCRIFIAPNKIVLFTSLPVKKGEQLFVSYGPSLDTEKEKRQQILQESFHFTCLCKPCKENWSLDLSDSAYEKFKLETQSYLDHENQELAKYCLEQKINPNLIHDIESEIYDLKSLNYHIKKADLAYKKLKNYHAFVWSLPSKIYIEMAFQKLYGIECNISNECYNFCS